MKVSITFDKDVKETNKKQWVKEIQGVVDKLNTKSRDSENKIQAAENKDRPRILSSEKRTPFKPVSPLLVDKEAKQDSEKKVRESKMDTASCEMIVKELMSMQIKMT